MHCCLIQRALGRLIEKALVHVAVPAAERRAEDLVTNIERVHYIDCFLSDGGEQLRVSGVELQDVLLGQIAVLTTRKKLNLEQNGWRR